MTKLRISTRGAILVALISIPVFFIGIREWFFVDCIVDGACPFSRRLVLPFLVASSCISSILLGVLTKLGSAHFLGEDDIEQ